MLQALAALAEFAKKLGIRMVGILMMIAGVAFIFVRFVDPGTVIGAAMFLGGVAIVFFGNALDDADTKRTEIAKELKEVAK